MSFASQPQIDARAQPVCLVLMPMLHGYEGIRGVVSRAISRRGALMLRLEYVLPDPQWQLWLIESVGKASCVLVDLTDHNPFVMYELGLAHSRGLPALLMVNSKNERVPATVLGSPFLVYSLADLAAFEAVLGDWIGVLARGEQEPLRRGSDWSYDSAIGVLREFEAATSISAPAVSREEFATRVTVASSRGERFLFQNDFQRMKWNILPRIIRDADRIETMLAIQAWTSQPRVLQVPGPPSAWLQGKARGKF